MNVITQDRPQPTPLPGIAHATWAGAAQGLTQLSMWRQTLAAGAQTPPHSHTCDEVVLCYAGHGEVLTDGRTQPFGPDTVIVLPRGGVHQINNVGETPLEILGVFGATPVATLLPDGAAIELPWRT